MTNQEQFDALWKQATEKYGEKGVEKFYIEKVLKLVSTQLILMGYKLPLWHGKGTLVDPETLLKFEISAMKQCI